MITTHLKHQTPNEPDRSEIPFAFLVTEYNSPDAIDPGDGSGVAIAVSEQQQFYVWMLDYWFDDELFSASPMVLTRKEFIDSPYFHLPIGEQVREHCRELFGDF
jgi:hypothetical protein